MIRRIPISDICTIYDGPHATPKKTEIGPIYLGINAITADGKLDPTEYAHLSDEDYVKWTKRVTPKPLDIVFSYEATLGRYAIIPEGFYGCLGRRLAIIRNTSKYIDTRWLYYYFRSPEWTGFINSKIIKGSTVNRISIEDFPSYTIPLIPFETQKKIVNVLLTIDEKIDTNQKISDNLQKQLDLLYDYWFTQFDFPDANGNPYKASGGEMDWNEQLKREIPKGWKDGDLYDIADYINGLACQKYRPREGEDFLPVIKIKEMHQGINKDTEKISINIPDKNKIENGDILFSWSATLEVMYWNGGHAGLNQHIFKVVPRDYFSKEYVYHQLSSYVINFVRMAEARKTTMGHITSDHLSQSKIVIPPESIIDQFNVLGSPLHKKIQICIQENLELVKLRDWLLPMLMNGQVTVE
ncbi:restriction endonuclease subunit S [Paenibacillus sp. MMS20-IR301]|uniref:restriction endonuclease subunit S n=1 Tax=Paenibacillus sp. MMS20-IR301 TaxID=2895946 RepID=UPI0028E8E32F|nr:restriction endonuclease subunit S [Paenibacillus sp. MMS20-IR301]WNS41527.1 restriction endonuclease subunit S [Paenibacillus sp. MMS20-IR301]